MLDPDKITFTRVDSGYRGSFSGQIIRATLHFQAEMHLSEFAMRTDATVEAHRRLAAQIWQHAYGDLRRPFEVLERCAWDSVRVTNPFVPDKRTEQEIANAVAIVRRHMRLP